MNNKTKEQPIPVADTDAALTLAKPTEKLGKIELDPATLARAEKLIEQGAKLELDLLKHVISSASIMCAQGRMFGKAKKMLWNKVSDDDAVEKAVEALYGKFGLATSTMNRRIQMWDEAVYREIIDFELQGKIEKSPTLTPEILAEMETQIGSITGTQFMRKLGILPPIEKPAKKAKTVKEKLIEKKKQLETLLTDFKQLLSDQELVRAINDKTVMESLNSVYLDLDASFGKFKSLELSEPPPLGHLDLSNFKAPSIVQP